MKSAARFRSVLWAVVIALALIGTGVATRRIIKVVPLAVSGYRPPTASSNPMDREFTALDDLFAPYPRLTLIHVVPGVAFMLLGPLQFNSTLRARHLRWHRWSGRVVVSSAVIGASARPNLALY
jgi:predicted membrane protein DUF2306